MWHRAARRRSTLSTEVPASVLAWAEEIADRAEVESSAEEHGWWIRVEPSAKGAVGFTLGISDEDEYDLFLDNGFAHEGWPWPPGVDPVELCRAIAAGRVRAEVSLWRGRELRRLVSIDCPPEIWTDLNVSLFDLLVPAGWRTARVDSAAAY